MISFTKESPGQAKSWTPRNPTSKTFTGQMHSGANNSNKFTGC